MDTSINTTNQSTSNQLPPAIIVDIDGVVADHDGIRDHYEWSKVGLDKPIKPLVSIVNYFLSDGIKVIFLTGRDSVCADDTKRWLINHFGEPIDPHFPNQGWSLHMPRKIGDRTSLDTDLKRQVTQWLIKMWQINLVLEDRPRNIRMFRDLGLKTLDCGNGEEF